MRTPLLHVAERNVFETVKLLVSRNDVEADSRDCFGMTPLHRAANPFGYRESEGVGLLAARDDVDVNSKNVDGQTPLDRAEEKYASIGSLQAKRTVEQLKKLGAVNGTGVRRS